jgi:hypothetical protein
MAKAYPAGRVESRPKRARKAPGRLPVVELQQFCLGKTTLAVSPARIDDGAMGMRKPNGQDTIGWLGRPKKALQQG